MARRVQSSEDRRVWHIRLTGKGRGVAKKVDAAPWQLLRQAVHALSVRERQTLIDILKKMAAHVGDSLAAVNGGDNGESR